MTCCVPYVEAGNSEFSDIPYTAAMRAVYGDLPKVSLYYLIDGDYTVAGQYVNVQFDGSRVFVDHGGVMRWMVKIN
jgi:hypothetical protein